MARSGEHAFLACLSPALVCAGGRRALASVIERSDPPRTRRMAATTARRRPTTCSSAETSGGRVSCTRRTQTATGPRTSTGARTTWCASCSPCPALESCDCAAPPLSSPCVLPTAPPSPLAASLATDAGCCCGCRGRLQLLLLMRSNLLAPRACCAASSSSPTAVVRCAECAGLTTQQQACVLQSAGLYV